LPLPSGIHRLPLRDQPKISAWASLADGPWTLLRHEGNHARGKRIVDHVPGARRIEQAGQVDDRQKRIVGISQYPQRLRAVRNDQRCSIRLVLAVVNLYNSAETAASAPTPAIAKCD